MSGTTPAQHQARGVAKYYIQNWTCRRLYPSSYIELVPTYLRECCHESLIAQMGRIEFLMAVNKCHATVLVIGISEGLKQGLKEQKF
jgi:hypothetical protein